MLRWLIHCFYGSLQDTNLSHFLVNYFVCSLLGSTNVHHQLQMNLQRKFENACHAPSAIEERACVLI